MIVLNAPASDTDTKPQLYLGARPRRCSRSHFGLILNHSLKTMDKEDECNIK